jgi:hypothetical protein
MNPASLQVLLGLLNVALPGGIALVGDIIALFKKYPGLTPEQFAAIVKEVTSKADAAYDATIAQILADQAAHKTP